MKKKFLLQILRLLFSLGQIYPHEPLLLNEEGLKKAIKEVKNISWMIYDFKRKKCKKYAKKGKVVIVNTIVKVHREKIIIETKEVELNKLSRLKIENWINRIEKYNINHPEKCYLGILKSHIENRKDKTSCHTICLALF